MADQELARDLGFLEAYTIGVGTMIGAGIFVLPGIVAEAAGPASMVSFAISGVVSLLTALSLSELATGMPRAGGSYYYVNRALGGFFGSIVGWGMWAGLMFATAFYMLGFGQYLTFFWGEMPVAIAALVMAFLLIAINYRGVKETSALQNLIVIALIGLILVFIAFGLFNIDWQVFRPFNPQGWGAVATSAATVYVAFIGFEVIATSAEEIKDPGRNLPLSMIASVLTPTLLYVLVMLVTTGVLPIAELAASYIPVADAAEVYLGGVGALIMVIGALLATISSANASVLSAARVNFAMGRDRILTSWLNEVHQRFRTPYRAILVTGGVILALIAIGVGIETLADVASFTYLMTYALVHIAVFVMRRAGPEDYDPDFKMNDWLYPVVPFLGFISCIVIIGQMRPEVLLIGSGIVLLGVVWYMVYARKQELKVSLVGEAIAARPRMAGVSNNEHYRVVVALANPETEKHLTRLAAAAAHKHENAEIVAINVIEVPPQTALEQGIRFEEERIETQRQLLRSARDAAEELDVGLRTRALVGRDVAQVILNVLKEEEANQLVMGWSGRHKRYQHVLGSNIDRIAREAPCEVSLVKIGEPQEMQRIVALAGHGPFAPLALQRAVQFARSTEGASLTLLRVESREQEEGADPEEVGQAVIADVAERAGVAPPEFEAKVVVVDDVQEGLLQAVEEYDTICVGATRSGGLTQALFGSIPERIGAEARGTVAIVRGHQYRPRSVTEGLVERLSR